MYIKDLFTLYVGAIIRFKGLVLRVFLWGGAKRVGFCT